MTFTLNGIGTRLVGKRALTEQEYYRYNDKCPYKYDEVKYWIATKAFVILFIPVIPLDTIIGTDVFVYKNMKTLESIQSPYMYNFYSNYIYPIPHTYPQIFPKTPLP